VYVVASNFGYKLQVIYSIRLLNLN